MQLIIYSNLYPLSFYHIFQKCRSGEWALTQRTFFACCLWKMVELLWRKL